MFYFSLLHTILQALWNRAGLKLFKLFIINECTLVSPDKGHSHKHYCFACKCWGVRTNQHDVGNLELFSSSSPWASKSFIQSVWLECFFGETRTGKDLAGCVSSSPDWAGGDLLPNWGLEGSLQRRFSTKERAGLFPLAATFPNSSFWNIFGNFLDFGKSQITIVTAVFS